MRRTRQPVPVLPACSHVDPPPHVHTAWRTRAGCRVPRSAGDPPVAMATPAPLLVAAVAGLFGLASGSGSSGAAFPNVTRPTVAATFTSHVTLMKYAGEAYASAADADVGSQIPIPFDGQFSLNSTGVLGVPGITAMVFDPRSGVRKLQLTDGQGTVDSTSTTSQSQQRASTRASSSRRALRRRPVRLARFASTTSAPSTTLSPCFPRRISRAAAGPRARRCTSTTAALYVSRAAPLCGCPGVAAPSGVLLAGRP